MTGLTLRDLALSSCIPTHSERAMTPIKASNERRRNRRMAISDDASNQCTGVTHDLNGRKPSLTALCLWAVGTDLKTTERPPERPREGHTPILAMSPPPNVVSSCVGRSLFAGFADYAGEVPIFQARHPLR
jgi:hypothetical protein